MKGWLSRLFVIIYAVLLPVLSLAAAGAVLVISAGTLAAADRWFPVYLAAVVVAPVLVAWRLYVLIRARRRAKTRVDAIEALT